MSDSTGKNNNATKSRKTTTANKTRSATARDALNPTLPSAEDLKDRFKTGSVPTETDFKGLIDLANAGAEATGQVPGQAGPGAGMRISETGQLEPNLESYNFFDDSHGCSPVMINSVADANNIVVDLHVGLTHVEHSGLSVKPGNGITVDTNGVKIKVKNNDVLSFDSDGYLQIAGLENYNLGIDPTRDGYSPVLFNSGDRKISVDVGNGLHHVKGAGLSVKINPYGGLALGSDQSLQIAGLENYNFGTDPTRDGYSPVLLNIGDSKISVDVGNGLRHVKGAGLSVASKTNSGIEVDEDGIQLKLSPSGELAINENGELHLKKTPALEAMFTGVQFQPGMIMAFNGSELPEGWALCDGKNNTPDLRTMFISTRQESDKKSDVIRLEDYQMVYMIKQ